MATCDKCKGKKTVIFTPEETGLPIGAEGKCPECKGTGETGVAECQECNDSKVVTLSAEDSPLNVAMEINCPKCSALEVVGE